MQFLKRTEHTHWNNETLLNDLYAALELLEEHNGTTTPSHLGHSQAAGVKWEIIGPWYSEGSSGGDRSGRDYYQVDQGLVQKLIEERLVEPRRVQSWGSTEERLHELAISPIGKAQLSAYHAEMLTRAKALLHPGKHTDLTGEPRQIGRHFRDPWKVGLLFYQFEVPTGDTVKVYPTESRIVETPRARTEAA